MSSGVSVLILHQEVGDQPLESDAGVLEEVAAVSRSLDSLGIACRVAAVASLEDVARAVSSGPEPVVFNLVEGFPANASDFAFVPAVCQSLGRAYTGSESTCLALTFNKAWCGAALRGGGVAVPDGLTVRPGEPVPVDALPAGPYLVKPVAADASEGIFAESSVVDAPGDKLDAAVESVHRRFGQPALIEQLVGSREFNVSIVEERGAATVLPLAEIDFSAFPAGCPRIVDYAAKWEPDSFAYHNTPRVIPAVVAAGLAERIRETALAAWKATGCRDYARVDIRTGGEGRLYVLEVNPNPDVSPEAGFAAALAADGRGYEAFVGERVRLALERRGGAAAAGEAGVADAELENGVRPTQAADCGRILEIVRAAENFRPAEMDVAAEVLRDSVYRGVAAGYYSFSAVCDGAVVGWVCFGPAPCTMGAYDIYWIVVDGAARRGGHGGKLMETAETAIARMGGRLVVLDTAGNDGYIPTRAFYSRLGYEEAARVKDFYAPGDDKVVFAKPL